MGHETKGEQDLTREAVQAARAKLAELIKDRMKQEGHASIADFADQHGIGRSTLYEITRGRTKNRGAWVQPSLTTAIALAKALDLSLHEIIYMLEPNAPGANTAPTPHTEAIQVPIAELTSAATVPTASEKAVYVSREFAQGKQLRAYRMQGHAMAAGKRPINHGDIIIINTHDKGHDGSSVIAKLKDGQLIARMLKNDKHGPRLESRNPEATDHAPSAIPINQAEIIGTVIRTITT